MKPLIGLVPLIDYEKNSLWMIPGYMDGVRAAGGIPVILPLNADIEDMRAVMGAVHGFILTGGHDVSPELYDKRRSPICGETSKERDALEYALIGEALRLDKPILGICRGLQLMNVYFGGTLYQDIPSERPSKLTHQMKPPYDRRAHDVCIEKDSCLYRIAGESLIPVNSYHHQAIRELGSGLLPSAYAPDGIVEAIEKPDTRFMLAVQWHPELDFHKNEVSHKLFSALCEAARP